MQLTTAVMFTSMFEGNPGSAMSMTEGTRLVQSESVPYTVPEYMMLDMRAMFFTSGPPLC